MLLDPGVYQLMVLQHVEVEEALPARAALVASVAAVSTHVTLQTFQRRKCLFAVVAFYVWLQWSFEGAIGGRSSIT